MSAATGRRRRPRLRWFLALWFWFALSGVGSVAGAQAIAGALREASAIAYDTEGNLYIADASAHQVVEATLGGALVVVAGNGVQGFAGDGGPAALAELNQPQGLAVGRDGTVYVADTGNHRVRAVSPGGTIATFAGTGAAGFAGDGTAAVAARLRGPTGVAIDSAGELLICDTGNHRIRRVSGGLITTVAGVGLQGFGGDGGPAVSARLDAPEGVTAAADGRVFVADTRNERVRVITPAGVMVTVVGNGASGFSGDGGSALGAALSGPRGVALDGAGNLLIADAGNQRVRRVDGAGVITTLAGSGVEGTSRDAAGQRAASLRAPRAVAVSSFGMPVFADTLNGTVRVLDGMSLYQPAALVTGRTSGVQVQVATAQTYGSGNAVASVQGPVGVPQGTLQLSEAGSAFGSATLNGGSATLDVSALGAGPHNLLLSYLGDGLNPATTRSVAPIDVSPLPVTATASSASVAYGAPLPQISGVISGVLPADAGGVSVGFGVSAGALPDVGTYPVVATLAGPKAANYAVTMSQSSGQLTVVKASDVASLDTGGQAFAGIPLTLRATVATSTRGQPAGTVQFLDGNTVIGTGTLSGGSVSAVYAAPPLGNRALSVQYLGDGNFLPSASGSTPVSVLAMPDFTVVPAGLQVASTSQGGSAAYTLTVSAAPGPFTGAIIFSATGLPAGASVNFSPPAVVPGTGSATVTVSVQTPPPAAASAAWSNRNRGGGVAAGLLGVALVRLRRRRSRVCLACAFAPLLLLTGCGARTVGEATGGALSRSYTVNVTGTATNLAGAVVTHSTALTLTVQQ